MNNEANKDKHIRNCPVCNSVMEYSDKYKKHTADIKKARCRKCANNELGANKRLSTEDFIKRANEIHQFNYDYSKFDYKTAKTKSIIICKIHGEFIQIANNHLNGYGCSKCTKRYIPTNEEFIERCNKIHNYKFDYKDVQYINNHTKIKIYCKKHGLFLQTPMGHATGKCCPLCSPTKPSDTIEFIQKCQKIHGNLFNYERVNYKNCETKVEIICKNHGSFSQTPSSHLAGRGCPKCNFENLSNIAISKAQTDFLDYLKIPQRNVQISNFIVDGLDNCIIYEFLGDYWHANPLKFNPSKIHPHLKVSFGEVYNKTFDRFKILKSKGYEIKYIWETDWNKFKKGKTNILNILTY